jgi:hypothetical protein
MKRVCEAVVLICLASGVLVLAQGDAATQVIAAARTALGGDTLAAVKTLTATGKVTRLSGEASEPTDVEFALELPSKYVRRETMPAMMGTTMTRSFGFNGSGLIDKIDRNGGDPNAAAGGQGNVRMFTRTSAGVSSPDQAAEAARGQLLKNQQEFSRFELGLFLTSLPDYPLEFTSEGTADAPCGKADVIGIKGTGDLVAKLYVNHETHRPACLTFMAREPMPQGTGVVSMGGGIASVAVTSMTMFNGGPAATAGKSQLQISGNVPPEMMERLKQMQADQEAAAAKLRTVEYRITYGDYKAVDGVQVPTKFQRWIDGKPVEELVLDRVKVNPKIDPARFEVTKVGG